MESKESEAVSELREKLLVAGEPSLKLTFLSSKLTFRSSKLTSLSPPPPFDTGCLPLSCSGNPGVDRRISQGWGCNNVPGRPYIYTRGVQG